MLDIIYLNYKGSFNHFHGVKFLSKNKTNILQATYLSKQNIYLVNITSTCGIHYERATYRLVPDESTGKKYCKLLKNGKTGYFLRAEGFLLYAAPEGQVQELLKNERKLEKEEKETNKED